MWPLGTTGICVELWRCTNAKGITGEQFYCCCFLFYMIRWYNCINDVRSSLFYEMAWPPFGAKPMPEPMRNYCQWDPRKKDNWFQTEKDNELASPGPFSNKLVFYMFNFQGKYYVLGWFFSEPLEFIYGVYFRFPNSWCRQHFNWLSYSYWLTDFRI